LTKIGRASFWEIFSKKNLLVTLTEKFLYDFSLSWLEKKLAPEFFFTCFNWFTHADGCSDYFTKKVTSDSFENVVNAIKCKYGIIIHTFVFYEPRQISSTYVAENLLFIRVIEEMLILILVAHNN
jgi:hypothetical protein